MKALRTVIGLSLFFFVATSVSVSAQQTGASTDQEKCKSVVQGFYDWYARTKGDWEVAIKRPVFGVELRRLMVSEIAGQKHSDDVGLDFDPFLNSQEEPFKHYVAGPVTLKDGRCLVDVNSPEASADDPKPIVTPELALEQGHWVFVNFHYKQTDPDPESENLVSMLKGMANDRKKQSK